MGGIPDRVISKKQRILAYSGEIPLLFNKIEELENKKIEIYKQIKTLAKEIQKTIWEEKKE